MKKFFEKLKKRIDDSTTLDKVLINSGKVLDVADHAADILVHLGPQMNAAGAVALGSRVVSSMRDSRLISAVEYFEKQEWVPLSLFGFEAQAWRYIHSQDDVAVLPIPVTYKDEQAFIADGLGVDIGFSMSGGHQGLKNHAKLKAESCWVRSEEQREKAMAVLGRGLWETVGTSKALLVKSGEGIAVIHDDEEETLPSRKGDEVFAKLKRYIDRGVHRSVFMIGEAGVGKSHMLRYIAQKAGGLCLRVKIADLSEISSTKMVKTVELLRPDCLIIDDFDRFVLGSRYVEDGGQAASRAAQMLDPLQQLNRLVKLFMVSANYSDNINEAVLRPGRFDELVEVHELDPELYERMLPGAPAKLIKALKKEAPPIAYIAELKKRVDVLGYEEAAEEMEELIKRSGRILELNKKKTSHTTSRRRKRASLVGKTKFKQAILMEERAARADKAALRAKEDALKAEEKAKEWREKAEATRKKGDEEKAAAEKKRAAKKAKPKAKAKKKKKAKPKKKKKVEAKEEPVPKVAEAEEVEKDLKVLNKAPQSRWELSAVRRGVKTTKRRKTSRRRRTTAKLRSFLNDDG